MRLSLSLALTVFGLSGFPAALLTAQDIPNPIPVGASAPKLDSLMPGFARTVLASYRGPDPDTHLNTLFRLQTVAGDQRGALRTLAQLRTLRASRDPVYARAEYAQYELYSRAMLRQPQARTASLAAAIRQEFRLMDAKFSDRVAYRVAGSFDYDLPFGKVQLDRALAAAENRERIPVGEAAVLVRLYHAWTAYRVLLPLAPSLMRSSEARRYWFDSTARVPLRDGNVLSAIIVRPRAAVGRQPTVLEFTIYANDNNRRTALEAAACGFVGIVATSRGKRASRGPVEPWEHEAEDAQELLSWIARQPWSDGRVGMTGASYAGFTQWAAAKFRHPALKTIVPAVAVAPGVDFPRENGIVLNFQYAWAHYVGGGPLLDESTYNDRARWSRLDSTWFARGSAYRDLDTIDGTPNPLFRRWLDHPAYDEYWRRMIPVDSEFSRIDIPVLSITGYFDGAQPGAMHYYTKHLHHHPAANHTVLIGPWDHFGAQRRPRPVLGSLRIDPVANIDIGALIFDWMDHVLRGAPRPSLLADNVNFQVIGTNRWRHVSSLAAMTNDSLSFVMRAAAKTSERDEHRLVPITTNPPGTVAADDSGTVVLGVDMRERHTTSSTFISLSADTVLDRSNAVVFVSDVLGASATVSGAFTGALELTANVRDVDLGVVLYERTARGEYIQLSYSLARASFSADPTTRTLLTPGTRSRVPLRGARITSRVVAADSRLVVVVNVNKNAESQLNYGSGKDPSDETLQDAATPMRIVLHSASHISVPVLR
jgi:putative CocE/NonD family hydrolase